MDNTFVLQQVIEKRTARNLSIHPVFIDLIKAYNTIPLKFLFHVSTKMNLRIIYVRALFIIYMNPQSTLKIGNTLSKTFIVTKG